MATVLVRLPDAERERFKAPLGPVFTDVEALLVEVRGPLVAVGDVVTYHLERAGRVPDVSVVDGRSQRTPVEPAIADALGEADAAVENPAATVTAELAEAIAAGLAGAEPTRIRVDGEEDLGVLPAVLAAPLGASVVYGQPGEGMVHVRISTDVKARTRELVRSMAGDPAALIDRAESG